MLTVEGTQVTTWNAAGAVPWCSRETTLVPVEGSGQQTLTLSTARVTNTSVRAGAALDPRDLALRIKAERTGTFTKHWSQLVRGTNCTDAPTADQSTPQTRCGVFGYLLRIGLAPGFATKTSDASVNRWGGGEGKDCAWLTSDLYPDGYTSAPGAEDFGATAADEEVYEGGLLAIKLPAVRAPGRPDGKTLRMRASSEISRTVKLEAVTVTMTTKLTFAVVLTPVGGAPKASVVPGRSLAGVRLGGTYAEARAATGTTARQPSSYEGGTSWGMQGKGLTVILRARGTTKGAPPPSAWIAEIRTSSRNFVTSSKIGVGSSLAEVRKAYPKGRRTKFGNTTTSWWIIDGPGARRTGFELSAIEKGNPVRLITIGCSGGTAQSFDRTKHC